MNKIIKEFSPRRFGNIQPMLLEFYRGCKEGKSVIFNMPEGKIYSQKAYDQALATQRADLIRGVEEIDIEPICKAVHKAYCQYCLDVRGKEYWTKGNYSKLDEATKEADRYTVRAVIKSLLKGLKE